VAKRPRKQIIRRLPLAIRENSIDQGDCMTNNTADEFFTANHDKLARIANIANVVAWIVFVVNIILVGARFVEVQHAFTLQSGMLGQDPDFWGMLSQKPLYAASFFVDMLSIFLRGAVYGLTLKGISLGLNMIIEIDLDNKERSQVDNNE
jgi:hypothetical protein